MNDDTKRGPTGPAPKVVSSTELLDGRREITIRHGDELYRLQLTGSNKLILVK